MKRLIIASAMGLITGVICYLGGKYGLKDDIDTIMFVYILANRTLAGFVIGLSKMKIKWYLHGPLIGFVVGIPFSLGTLIDGPIIMVFIFSLILSALYGFIIEFFTSVLFRQNILGTSS